MISNFSILSKEYQGLLDDEYKTSSSLTRAASATFVKNLYIQIKANVHGKLTNIKQGKRKHSNSVPRSRMADDSESEPSDEGLVWESETDSNAGSAVEELVSFRFEDLKVATTPLDAKTEFSTDPVELDQAFLDELSSASRRADFDEHYIQEKFEKQRLARETGKVALPEDSVGFFQSVLVDRNLEQISLSLLAEANGTYQDESTAQILPSIRELEVGAFEISQSSKGFSKFIPIDSPLLNVTDEMLNNL